VPRIPQLDHGTGKEDTMNRHLTQALERLNNDRGYRRAFRRDPKSATRALRLTTEEIDALRSGDETRLAALGADVASVRKQPTQPRRLAAFALAYAPAVAALLLTLSIGSYGLTRSYRSAARRRTGGRAMRVMLKRAGAQRLGVRAMRAKRARFGIRARLGPSSGGALAAVPVDLLA